MQMIRLTLDDSNLQKRNDRLIWDIPLNVENHKVGLSSIALDVADHYDPHEHKFVKIKCIRLRSVGYKVLQNSP